MPSATVDDFREVPWGSVLADEAVKTASHYAKAFGEQAAAAEEDGDDQGLRVYRFLQWACRLHLQTGDPQRPFGTSSIERGPPTPLDGWEGIDTESLSTAVEDIENPEIQARIADVLWYRTGDHELAQKAGRAYLRATDEIIDPESWSRGFTRLERAFEIARVYNLQELREEATDKAEELLERYEGEDPKYLTPNLVELLLEQNPRDPERYAEICGKGAGLEKGQNVLDRRRAFLEAKALALDEAGEEERARQARIDAAETHVERADQVDNAGLQASFLEDAIAAYRRIGDTEDRVQELKKRLVEAQKGIPEEMAEISLPEDQAKAFSDRLTKQSQQLRKEVKGRELPEAMAFLASVVHVPDASEMRNQAAETEEKAPLMAITPRTIVNRHGRTVDKKSPAPLGAEEEMAPGNRLLHHHLSFSLSTHAVAGIEPVRDEINRNHRPTRDDFIDLVDRNPLVPPGHEGLFAKGLYQGMRGDFANAVHLLAPQLENAFRYVLYQHGVIPSSYDDEGIQDEYDLNRILWMEEFEEIAGDDLVLLLRHLLVSREGQNLRNRIAHGLATEAQLQTWPAVYVWGLTLRLLFSIGWVTTEVGAETEDDSTHETED